MPEFQTTPKLYPLSLFQIYPSSYIHNYNLTCSLRKSRDEMINIIVGVETPTYQLKNLNITIYKIMPDKRILSGIITIKDRIQ